MNAVCSTVWIGLSSYKECWISFWMAAHFWWISLNLLKLDFTLAYGGSIVPLPLRLEYPTPRHALSRVSTEWPRYSATSVHLGQLDVLVLSILHVLHSRFLLDFSEACPMPVQLIFDQRLKGSPMQISETPVLPRSLCPVNSIQFSNPEIWSVSWAQQDCYSLGYFPVLQFGKFTQAKAEQIWSSPHVSPSLKDQKALLSTALNWLLYIVCPVVHDGK